MVDIELTLYYATWCGHCTKFKPIWEQLKKHVEKNTLKTQTGESIKVTFKACEAQKDKELVDKANIAGFPTLMITKGGVETEYKGRREFDAILEELTRVDTPIQAPIQAGGADERKYYKKYKKYKRLYMELLELSRSMQL